MAYGCGYEGGYTYCDLISMCTYMGGGYAGGQFAALMYGGGVPCNEQTSIVISQGAIQSNVEEYCILEYSCAL